VSPELSIDLMVVGACDGGTVEGGGVGNAVADARDAEVGTGDKSVIEGASVGDVVVGESVVSIVEGENVGGEVAGGSISGEGDGGSVGLLVEESSVGSGVRLGGSVVGSTLDEAFIA